MTQPQIQTVKRTSAEVECEWKLSGVSEEWIPASDHDALEQRVGELEKREEALMHGFRSAMGEAIDGCGVLEAGLLLVSQRDNARNDADALGPLAKRNVMLMGREKLAIDRADKAEASLREQEEREWEADAFASSKLLRDHLELLQWAQTATDVHISTNPPSKECSATTYKGYGEELEEVVGEGDSILAALRALRERVALNLHPSQAEL